MLHTHSFVFFSLQYLVKQHYYKEFTKMDKSSRIQDNNVIKFRAKMQKSI